MSAEEFNHFVSGQRAWNNWTPDKGDALYKQQLEYYQKQGDPKAAEKAMLDVQSGRDMLLTGGGDITADDIAKNYHNLNGLDIGQSRSILESQARNNGITHPEVLGSMVDHQLSALKSNVASGTMTPEQFNNTLAGIHDWNSWDDASQKQLFDKQLRYYQDKNIPNAEQRATQDVQNARNLSMFGEGKLDPSKVVQSFGTLNAMDPNAEKVFGQFLEDGGWDPAAAGAYLQDERLKILKGSSTVEEFNKTVAGMRDYSSFTDEQGQQLYQKQLQYYQDNKVANPEERAKLDVSSARDLMLMGGGELPPDKLLQNFDKINQVNFTDLEKSFAGDPNVPEEYKSAYAAQRLSEAKYNILTGEWTPDDIALAVKGQNALNAFTPNSQQEIANILQKQGLSPEAVNEKLLSAQGMIANGGGEFTGDTVKQLANAGYFSTQGSQLGLSPTGGALGFTDAKGMWKSLGAAPPKDTPIFTFGTNGQQQLLGLYNAEGKFEGTAGYFQVNREGMEGQKIYLADLAGQLPDPAKDPFGYESAVFKLVNGYGPYTDVQVFDRVGGLIETVKANQLGDKYLGIEIGETAADGTFQISNYGDWYTRQMTGQNDRSTLSGQMVAGLTWAGGKIFEALSPVGEAIGKQLHGFDQWFDPLAQGFIKSVDDASGNQLSAMAKGYDNWLTGLQKSDNPWLKAFGDTVGFMEGFLPSAATDLMHNREHKFGWLDFAEGALTATMATGVGIAGKFALKNILTNAKLFTKVLKEEGIDTVGIGSAFNKVFGKGVPLDPKRLAGPEWAQPLGKYLWNSEYAAIRRAVRTLPMSYGLGAGVMGALSEAENLATGTPWDMHDTYMTFAIGGPVSMFWSLGSRNALVPLMEKLPAQFMDDVKTAVNGNAALKNQLMQKHPQLFNEKGEIIDNVQLSKMGHVTKELGIQTIFSNLLMKEGDPSKNDAFHTINTQLSAQHIILGRLLGAVPTPLAKNHSFTAMQLKLQAGSYKFGQQLENAFGSNALTRQLKFAGPPPVKPTPPGPTAPKGEWDNYFKMNKAYDREFKDYIQTIKFRIFGNYVFWANLGVVAQSKSLQPHLSQPHSSQQEMPIPLIH
jgi:hypothetical protein